MSKQHEHDARGNPIPPDEADDAIIEAWEIEPAMSICPDADVLLIRDYYQACECAKDIISNLMDGMDPEEDGYPCQRTLTVRLVKVRKDELPEDDDD